MGGHTRTATRTTTVLFVSMMLLAAMAFVPAQATSGGDDIEAVRATVTETYNHKITLLEGMKAETGNADRQAVYQGGIDQLRSLRDGAVAQTQDIEELWGLKERAHGIYHDTVAAAEQVGMTPEEELAKAKDKANSTIAYKIKLLRKWIEGCDDPTAQAIVADGIAKLEALYGAVENATEPAAAYAAKDQAHAIYHDTINRAEAVKSDGEKGDEKKDDAPEEKTEAEKRAEALAKARSNTLTVIARKAAILRSAAAAARVPAVIEVYETKASEVEALEAPAKQASSVKELDELTAQALALYEAAKEAALAIREGVEGENPEHTLDKYLARLTSYVTTTVAAAARTSDASPDTFEALVRAKTTVLDRIDAVATVAESGNRLGDRWVALNSAMRDFRRALLRHYIALGEPMMLDGLRIPG